MKKLLFAAALLLACTAAYAAETVKAEVGHMCCGHCKSDAMAGVKNLSWVGDVSIDGTTITVTAKDGSHADIASLMTGLRSCGFPAKAINVSGPVTLTISHMCCPNCVAGLKAAMDGLNDNRHVDKAAVKIDLASKTMTIQPTAGESVNLAMVLRSVENAGFSTDKCTLGAAAATTTK